MFENHPECRIWILAFPPKKIVLLKLTCLVTLLQVFKNSPKLSIFGIFNELLAAQNINVARFARIFLFFFFLRIWKHWNIEIGDMQNGNQFEETKKNTEKSWKSNSSRKPQNLQNKRFMENFNAPLASLEVRTQNGLQHAKWVIYKSRFFEFGQDVKSTYGFLMLWNEVVDVKSCNQIVN